MVHSILANPGSWLLALGRSCATGAVRSGGRILARIFLREPDPVGWLPVGKSVRSNRYLSHLGRLRRREVANARALGSLADAVRRQGLHKHARRLSRAAFDHWRLARKAEERLCRKADDALRGQAL
jgi:hypothetical protein